MAGSSNFTQHNPTAANQLDDTDFDSSSLTTGGIGTDATLPSNWLNKRWYQDSTFVAALAQALANKGYVLSDANIGTLEAVLANIVTNADLKQPLLTVAYSPTPVFPAAGANGFDFVLSGNVTSSTLTGTSIGQILTFVIVQGSSAFTFTPPTNINGWDPISNTPNAVSVQQFIVRADGTIWPASNASSQTYPSRTTGTAYTNNSGSPLHVVVTGNFGNSGSLALNIGTSAGTAPSLTACAGAFTNNGGGGTTNVSCFVMPGFQYSVTSSGGFVGLQQWVETVI